jgi:vacuolar protein sorting-associated protein 54
VLTGDLVGAARQVQELNATRGNLVELQQKVTVILYVSQALAALKLVSAFSRQHFLADVSRS